MNAEQEAKLKEIFDILLSAGYFRCRIPSISTFDKLLGGLAWCIALSNFDIDVQFADDMNMGQKIKLSEKVVDSLRRMNCPYQLQPYQIQGLDLKNIFPVVQWLINFVLETRDVRQNFNKSMAMHKGSTLYGLEKEPQARTFQILQKQNMKDRRVTKNTKIESYKLRDPLRVYSSLMEYDDKTAVRTYNRLSLWLAGEEKRKEKEEAEKEKVKGKPTVGGKETAGQTTSSTASSTTTVGSATTSTSGGGSAVQNSILKKAMADEKGSTTAPFGREAVGSKASKEAEEMDSLFISSGDGADEAKPDIEFVDIRRGRSGSISGQELYKIVVENRQTLVKDMQNAQNEDDEEEEMATMLKQENEFFEEQKTNKRRQIEKLEDKSNVREQEAGELKGTLKQVEKKYKDFKQLNTELSDTAEVIEKKIEALKSKASAAKFSSLEALTKRKEDLKTEKSTLKKAVKAQIVKLEEEKKAIEEAYPVYSEPIDEGTMQEYNAKKEKYDKRYKDFANLNQEIAVMQRKIEGFTSSIETAQYYKRFIELYERINFEMELYRDHYVKFNNYQDIKAALIQQNDLMKSFKEGVSNLGKDSKRKENFLKDLGEALKGLQENMKRSSEILSKGKAQRDKNSQAYNQLINQERQYYSYLRELQLEYEKNDKLSEALNIKQ